MTDFTSPLITASTVYAFDSGNAHYVTAFGWQVYNITSPRIRVLDSVSPQRLQYAGQAGLSYVGADFFTGLNRNYVIRHWPIAWDLTDYSAELAGGQWYADSVFCRIPPGMEMYIYGSYA